MGPSYNVLLWLLIIQKSMSLIHWSESASLARDNFPIVYVKYYLSCLVFIVNPSRVCLFLHYTFNEW